MGETHQNILVIKLGALGDFVQALGPMAAIRRHHPEARITLLTTRPLVSFAEQSGYFNNILIDDRPRWHDVKGWLALRRTLNAGGFTRVYDLQNNDRTSFYLRLFGQKPEWVGIAPGASHRNTSPQRTAGQAFDGHVQTLALAGITDVVLDDLSWIAGDIEAYGLQSPYVLLVPGSAPQHPQKRWPAASYGALAARLAEKGYQPVIIGTAGEAELAEEIRRICPAARDLTGRTDLLALPVLARQAAGAVGNDTGPMHLIAPAGCPSIVLFSGASNPVRHAPKGARLTTLRQENLRDLTGEEVEQALFSVMAEGGGH